MVDLPTRNGVILDIILMSIPQLYNAPIIVPPVPCDNPSDGVPSDHYVPVCVPHTDMTRPPVRHFKTVTYRPLPESGMREFGSWITAETFSTINDDISPSSQASALETLLLSQLDKYCPKKNMRIGPQDKPWINFELKVIKRRKMREWNKSGKTPKYVKLDEKFKFKYNAAAKKYMQCKVEALKESQPGKAYSIFKSMGAQPGDCTDNNTFTLPNHMNLSDQECAEAIAEYFASISREYTALDLDQLPERVKQRLRDKSAPPYISELDCYQKLVKAKKPKSEVLGDLPSSVVKEFTVELAAPLSKLLNNIVQSASWPDQYKVEYVTPIGKVPQPESEDDIRPISLTNFFSKVMEHFVVMWLLDIIGDKMDFRQYGGVKGNSVSHYLIEFLNFILYSQDGCGGFHYRIFHLLNFHYRAFHYRNFSLPNFFHYRIFSLPKIFTTENFHLLKFSPPKIFTTDFFTTDHFTTESRFNTARYYQDPAKILQRYCQDTRPYQDHNKT